MAVVFAKTPKGTEEMTNRSGALGPRVRRVLIMIDGKRTVEDLRAMLQADDLQTTLGLLEEDGYIVVAAAGTAGGKMAAPAAPLPSITAFTELPATHDPVRLQRARNFMVNTLNTFVGRLGTSALLDRLDAAKDHAELRASFDEWYHAIVMSREGRREAEGLRAKLLEVI
ncbi:MAG: hypothetical protein FIB06_06990 [Betaproteobacteria bacterium]|nr:hypothetical protein [Betaproteobacteria bacterium]